MWRWVFLFIDFAVDDTGIEPVTPTMSILAYAVLRVSSVLSSY